MENETPEQPVEAVEQPETPAIPEPAPTEESPVELQIPEPAPKPEAPAVDQAALQEVSERILKSGGQITDGDYATLASAGFVDRGMVDQFYAGQMALRAQQQAQVYDALGGKDTVQGALEWAQHNLGAEEVAQINSDLAGASVAGQTTIIRGLVAQAGGSQVKTLKATTNAVTSEPPFQSAGEFHQALMDPRYKTDKAFQKSVEDRLSRSNIRAAKR